MMAMYLDELDTDPKVKAVIWDHVEQMRHTSDPMDIGEMMCSGNLKGKDRKGAGKSRGNNSCGTN